MKYLDQIQNAVKECGEDFVIPGALIMVEKLEEEEIKTKSGIVIADASRTSINSFAEHNLQKVLVVAVGAGFLDKSGNDVPVDSKVGDIIFTAKHSIKWLPVFPVEGYKPDTLGFMSEESTQIRFRGIEAYEKFKKSTESKT